MKILLFPEYLQWYKEKGFLFDKRVKKVYNDKQIKTLFNKYFERETTKEMKRKIKYEESFNEMIENIKNKEWENHKDKLWEVILERIKTRDNNQCRLIKCLSQEELNLLLKNAPKYDLNILQGAHCIRRSRCKELIYEEDNVYLINSWSHFMLDNYRSPITGEFITKEEIEKWWKRIIGEIIYNSLQERKNESFN